VADQVAAAELVTRGTSSSRLALSDTVWLNDRSLISLPESAFALHASNLRALSCAANFINELPLFIGRFSALQSLLVANNSFTALPHQHLQFLGQRLTRLTELDINRNGLTFFPLEGFASLCTLRLENNCLLELPHTLSRMSRLTELYASHNQLQALPDNLPQELTVLRTIYYRLMTLTCVTSVMVLVVDITCRG
jgi:Leucine-rich repeat (LRR) protein